MGNRSEIYSAFAPWSKQQVTMEKFAEVNEQRLAGMLNVADFRQTVVRYDREVMGATKMSASTRFTTALNWMRKHQPQLMLGYPMSKGRKPRVKPKALPIAPFDLYADLVLDDGLEDELQALVAGQWVLQ